MVALLWVFGESDDIVFRGSTPPILGTQRWGRLGKAVQIWGTPGLHDSF